MRKFLKYTITTIIGLTIALELLALAAMHYPAPTDLPDVKDGDLVFQTSFGMQSLPVFIATKSAYTHMGVVAHRDGQPVVIEAMSQVCETPLAKWVAHGLFKRVSIYRDEVLKPAQAKGIVAAAKTYEGKPYDIFFLFDNDAIYCSELPYLAFRKAGIPLGTVQKLSELNIRSAPVQKLIQSRWARHPVCKARRYDYTACYQYLMDQKLISPASIAADEKLTEIYSNYP